MSLTDELFSVLESKETDSRKSNSDARRSKSSPRTHSYLTEDTHRTSSSSRLAQPGGSGQDRSRHEDARGAGRYDRDDHGHRKRDDAGDGLPIDGGAVGRRYERRSGSLSSQREPPLPARDGQYVKSDRSEDLRGSKPDPRSSRFHDEPGWQPGRSSQHLADERRKNGYAAEGGRGSTKDYSVSDDAHKFDDKSKRDSYEAAKDLPKKNTLPDKKYVERCAKNYNDGSEPNRNGSYENDTRKSAKKYSKGNDNNDEVPYRIINYRKLEEIVNGNPVELVVSLANRHSGFENKLREKLSPDFIMLIMKALAKICKAEFHENKVGILSHACEADFLNQVADYLMKLPFETDENRRSRIDEFLFDILTFCKTTMDLLPDKACDKLPNMLDTTERAMRCVEACLAKKFPDALNEGFVDLDCRLKVRIGEREMKHKKATSDNAGQDQKPPPDDFREISIYPTPRDILNSDATFIRPNIVKGAYSSVDHYLDVQFRLLREDFVCPLREGITDYMSKTLVEGKRKKRINNVRIYRKVNFIAPKVVNDVVGLEVCFDSSDRCSKVNWEHNKRFMFGSLLCFTNDNFANIFFGTIVERKVESLKKGLIVVELRDVDHINDRTFYSDFIMAESEVYFEPYFHVLKALQKLQARTFPMRQYIVDVDVRSAAPVYIQNQPNFQYNIDGHNVSVLDDLTWPSAEQLHLDDSQYVAFKSALTKEFVVIQGPPGTGKTYIGLKITEVLLKNSPIWNASNKPILVVCYTNHALDQFLEGILKYTSEIVRAGGQSKSETLTQFNLRERRRKNVRSADVSLLMRDIHSNVSHKMADIKLIQLDLESINSGKGIISLHTLKAGGISSGHLSCFFTNDGKIDDDVFIEWLEIGMQYCDEPEFHNAERSEGGSAERVDTDAPELEGDPNEGVWQNALYNPIDFALDDLNITTHVKFAFLFDTLRGDIAKLHQKRATLENLPDPAVRKACFQLDREIREYHKCLNYWQNCVQSSGRCDREAAESLLRGANLWQLSPNERWTIYSYWVSNLKRRMLGDLRVLERELRVSAKRYEEVKQIGDLHVMKNALVIGMTTTGAARLQPLLQALKPRIVIVEEAAEVLESHIVVSLTSECQHLILIGDHKQLRPSAAVFKLAREYKLEVSLFERMLANGMHCETLKVQHRMRPEIAQLIVPAVYPELRNHESVGAYEHVQGTTKSLFFVAHNHPEEEVEDSQSRRNIHEAKFLVALARHLVLQGYSPEEITVLTTYKGQMFLLRSESRGYSCLKGLTITVVDNYQGEENDIVLLSLVRSNKDAVIGFLKTENRVCVALSRAKKGFFIIGNLDNLTRSSVIWPKVKETLERQEAVGSHLTLRCQLHTAQFTRVASAEDFHAVPEGGCCLPCGAEMGCGHVCLSVCHVLNREHTDYKCLEPCRRAPENCPVGHPCLKPCWQVCGMCMTKLEKALPCGHMLELPCHVDPEKHKCRETVTAVLPDCEHEVEKPCHADPERFPCPRPCEDRLPCGHSCEGTCHVRTDPDHTQFKCYKPCSRKNTGCKADHPCKKQCYQECADCDVLVEKQLPGCSHKHTMKCCTDPSSVTCQRRCQRVLDCGHPCPKKCFETCGGCPVKVKKAILSCGHDVELECWQPAVPSACRKLCEKLLPCGHACTERCSAPCTPRCLEPVPGRVRPACNHAVEVPCFQKDEDLDPHSDYLLSRCAVPCGTVLECGHPCHGTCGQCLQGRVHMACLEECGKPLICGHRCWVPCSVSCPPCNRKCNMFRCRHSRCSNKCGEACTPCTEQCGWRCEHMRCTRKCHEICNREPCTEPCRKVLECGHACIGFCGEPCPPLCRVCDAEEVTTIFFGTEQEEDARFVYLEDCRHVLESEGLEQWMQQSDSEIKMKVCPVCTTPITKTQRYMNVVKRVYEDVSKVKRKVYGDLKAFCSKRNELSGQLKATVTLIGPVLKKDHLKLFSRVYAKLNNELNGVRKKRRGTHSSADMAAVQIQVQVLGDMAKTVKGAAKALDARSKEKLSDCLHVLLRVLDSRGRKVSDQEVEDVNRELKRLYRISQLLVLESEPAFAAGTGGESVAAAHGRASELARSIEKYTGLQDEKLKVALEDLKKALKSSAKLTDKERREIVKAMGLKQGHWYKCPNGHPYVITECGGAMQVGKCNECGADIGGQRHTLLPSNAVASEMDGATRPAWPR
ncbi:NFX1-type zinc finger-containing protein 1-like [Bacillus rossius redtenbacheri]|uniref:NFX1-type zinc finger-containing protein 1-like n=1 Tax=Bacillus rossius redtenbacheri TaxID=93214 RepID=UPI002FDECEAC